MSQRSDAHSGDDVERVSTRDVAHDSSRAISKKEAVQEAAKRRIGALLVAGKSKRMGRDKANVVVDGLFGRDGARFVDSRFVDLCARALAPQCELFLVGALVGAPPQTLNGERIPAQQTVDDGHGPLQALAPFFARKKEGAAPDAPSNPEAPSEWDELVIAPVDVAGLTAAHIDRLVRAVQALPHVDGARFSIASEHAGGTHAEHSDKDLALPVLLTRHSFDGIAEAIESGQKRLAATLSTLDLVHVEIDDDSAKALMNINTESDLRTFERAQGERGKGVAPSFGDDDERLRSHEVVRIALPGDDANTRTNTRANAGTNGGTTRTIARDVIAEEEPLEIRIQGASVAITMRTPGHDLDLVRGFLWTEGLVDDAMDIVRIAHCTRVEDPEAEDNTVDVTLRPGLDFDLERVRRNTFAHSSCGVCGKATLEAALAVAPALVDDRTLSAEHILCLPDLLRADQEVFAHTGGLHAAGVLVAAPTFGDLASGDSALGRAVGGKKMRLEVVREDVGRHNAIDKVVGFMAGKGSGNDGRPALALVVSGRVSFEVVQKAARARWPIIVAISAPTALAVRLAQTLGITLVGFVRANSMNVYTHPHRIR